MWRGGLPPFGCEAVVKPLPPVYRIHRGCRSWGCFAAQRGQAPSPQQPAPTGNCVRPGLRARALTPSGLVALHRIIRLLVVAIDKRAPRLGADRPFGLPHHVELDR